MLFRRHTEVPEKTRQLRSLACVICLILSCGVVFRIGVSVQNSGIRGWKGPRTAVPKASAPKPIAPQLQDVAEFAIAIVSLNARTNHTRGSLSHCDLTEANQADYARKHGYLYKRYHASLDPSLHVKWSKFLAVREVMGMTLDQRPVEWVLWLDCDVVVTNMDVRLEDIIRKYSFASTEMILVRAQWQVYGRRASLNSGVMLLKNGPFTKDVMQTLLSNRAPMNTKITQRTAVDQPQLIKELEARNMLKFPPENDVEVTEKVTTVSMRVMGANYRIAAHYATDLPDSQWRKGDFLAHVNGLLGSRTAVRVVQSLLDGTAPPAAEAMASRFNVEEEKKKIQAKKAERRRAKLS